MKFFIIFFLMGILCKVLSNEHANDLQHKSMCKQLFQEMGESNKNYECCKNPELFMWSNSSTFAECEKNCGNDTDSNNVHSDYNCCKTVCVLTKMEFLRFSTDPNVMPQVEVKGVIAVYMLSVDNDPVWLPIVKSATERCFDDTFGLLAKGYYCNVIPNSLGALVKCNYREFFLQCPYWNPQELDRCEAALEYEKECADNT